MPYYEEPYSDIKELFDELLESYDIKNHVSVKILVDDKQKKVYKLVKANDLVKHMTGKDVVIVINQRVFDQLDDDQKRMQADEALCGIGYDSEKDKVVFTREDLVTFKGVISKYGWNAYDRLQETIKSLYDQKKNEESELEGAEPIHADE